MNDQSLADNYGVNYIIRGSMQVMGQNARLNLEITDIDSSEIVISKKEDFNLDNIFAVQDKMSNTILDELQIGLGVGEKQGSNWSSNFNSLDEFSKFLHFGRASTVSILIFVSVVPIIVLNVFRNKEENSL